MSTKTITQAEFEALIGEDLIRFLIEALEAATDHVRQYFRDIERKYDSTLAATMIRRQMKWRLEDARNVRFSEIDNGFVLEKPYHIGVWFEFEGVCLRAYKVRKDGLPLPGGSDSRNRFFANLEPNQRSMSEKDWQLNAAILWTIDGNGGLSQLRFVVPTGFDEDGQLQLAYEKEIPTTLAEFDQNRHFVPAQEPDEILFVTPLEKDLKEGDLNVTPSE